MDKLRAQGAKKVCRRSDHFVLTIQILLRAALVGMAFYSPHLLTKLCASIKLLYSVWLPSLWGPKFAFAVCNFIIVFLVRQPRPSTPDIYHEYAAMQGHCFQSLASESVNVRKEIQFEVAAEAEPFVEVSEVESSTSEDEVDEIVVAKEEEEETSEEEEDGVVSEEEEGWTAEELNRRVEEFIAKVNMQRRMEARINAYLLPLK